MTIDFPDRPEPWYDVDQHTITFPVRIDGRPKACVVSAAELMQHFAGRPYSSPAEARAVFEGRKDALRRMAEAAIRKSGSTHPCNQFQIRLSE